MGWGVLFAYLADFIAVDKNFGTAGATTGTMCDCRLVFCFFFMADGLSKRHSLYFSAAQWRIPRLTLCHVIVCVAVSIFGVGLGIGAFAGGVLGQVLSNRFKHFSGAVPITVAISVLLGALPFYWAIDSEYDCDVDYEQCNATLNFTPGEPIDTYTDDCIAEGLMTCSAATWVTMVRSCHRVNFVCGVIGASSTPPAYFVCQTRPASGASDAFIGASFGGAECECASDASERESSRSSWNHHDATGRCIEPW